MIADPHPLDTGTGRNDFACDLVAGDRSVIE
jgi:hypothetical protein